MAHGDNTIPIPGELRSEATDGVVTSADAVKDYKKGKFQEQVNKEVDTEIENIKGGASGSIASLQQEIDDIKGGSDDSIASLKQAIGTEKNRAEVAENNLRQVINNEKARAEEVEATKANASDVYSRAQGTALESSVAQSIFEQNTNINNKFAEQDATLADQDDKLDNIQATVNAKQLEIGAVETDLEPTKNSPNIINSGALYNVYGHYVDNPEYLQATTDSDSKILRGIKSDGTSYIAGDLQVEGNIINKHIQEATSFFKSNENQEWLQMTRDSDEKIICGIKTNGMRIENCPIEIPSAIVESQKHPELLQVTEDKEGKIIESTDKEGNKYIYSLEVDKLHFNEDIPEQIKEFVNNFAPSKDTDSIPYNDILSVGARIVRIYNPYKENNIPEHFVCSTVGDNINKVVTLTDGEEYELQTGIPFIVEFLYPNTVTPQSPSFVSLKVGDGEAKPLYYNGKNVTEDNTWGCNKYLEIVYDGEKYVAKSCYQYTGQLHCHTWTGMDGVDGKFPYGYTVDYVKNYPNRQELLDETDTNFVQTHKNLGYDFMTITNYERYGDVTHKPQRIPEDFLWLSDGYESETHTNSLQQHIIIHSAPLFSEPASWDTFYDVMCRVEDYGCVVQWPHPTYYGTYARPDVVSTVKNRLRLIEVYNGLSARKYYYDGSGNTQMTNRDGNEFEVADVILDEPFDGLLSQGNFVFGTAASDERPAAGKTEQSIAEPNHPKNIQNGCVKVFSNDLTSESVYKSLLSGNFYASTDANININSITIENGEYIIDVGMEDVVVEFLKENNTIVKTETTSQEHTTASYEISGEEKFVRARLYKLFDSSEVPYDRHYWYKNKKWIIFTQPLFIEKIIL